MGGLGVDSGSSSSFSQSTQGQFPPHTPYVTGGQAGQRKQRLARKTGYYSCTQKEECSTPFYQNGYYHCENGKWHWVDECFVEMKKLSTKKAKDGDSQWGKKCPSKCYVFESDTSAASLGSWRYGDITECLLGLGGCTQKRRGETKFGPYTEISTNCDGYYCWKYIKPLDKDAPQDAPYYCRYEDDVCHPHEWR